MKINTRCIPSKIIYITVRIQGGVYLLDTDTALTADDRECSYYVDQNYFLVNFKTSFIQTPSELQNYIAYLTPPIQVSNGTRMF